MTETAPGVYTRITPGARDGRPLGALVHRHPEGRRAVHRPDRRPRRRMTAAPSLRLLRVADRLRGRRVRGRDRDRAARECPVRQVASRWLWLAAALLATLAWRCRRRGPTATRRATTCSRASASSRRTTATSRRPTRRRSTRCSRAPRSRASRSGSPSIVTPYDLGSVPILFNAPQSYAKFLAAEDGYYWKDELLVVMPKGYGIYKAKNLPTGDKAVIAKLPPPTGKTGPELAAAAETAIQALAAQHGLKLSTGGGTVPGKQLVGLGRARRDPRRRDPDRAGRLRSGGSSGGAGRRRYDRGRRRTAPDRRPARPWARQLLEAGARAHGARRRRVAVVLLVIGAVLASNTKQKPPRVVTIPLADRSASAALHPGGRGCRLPLQRAVERGRDRGLADRGDEPSGGDEPSPRRIEGAGLHAPHPDRRAGLARVAARQGGSARALRHLVPALRRRGAASEGDVPRAPEEPLRLRRRQRGR